MKLEWIAGLHVIAMPAPTDLGALLQTAVNVFALQSDRHWIHLDVEDGLPRVRADADRIHQVVANLLSGSYRISPQSRFATTSGCTPQPPITGR